MSGFEQRLARYLQGSPSAPRKQALATRLLFHAAHHMEARMDEVLAAFGLVMREYLALAILNARHDEAIRPSELSVSLDATRTQITRLLDGLETRGLLRRKPKAEDRRGLDLELTAAGARLFAQAAPAVHQAYRDWWAAFDGAALDTAIDGLRRLNAALAKDGEA